MIDMAKRGLSFTFLVLCLTLLPLSRSDDRQGTCTSEDGCDNKEFLESHAKYAKDNVSNYYILYSDLKPPFYLCSAKPTDLDDSSLL